MPIVVIKRKQKSRKVINTRFRKFPIVLAVIKVEDKIVSSITDLAQ